MLDKLNRATTINTINGLKNLEISRQRELKILATQRGGNPNDYLDDPRITSMKINSQGDVVRVVVRPDGTTKEEYLTILHPSSF